MGNVSRLGFTLLLFLFGVLSFLDYTQAGTITGTVVNKNGSVIKTGVTIQAFCPTGGQLVNSTVSLADGTFKLVVDPSACPNDMTVNLTFQRHGTAPPPELTMSGTTAVSSSMNVNLMMVTVPATSRSVTSMGPKTTAGPPESVGEASASCGCASQEPAPPCRRGVFRLFRRCN